MRNWLCNVLLFNALLEAFFSTFIILTEFNHFVNVLPNFLITVNLTVFMKIVCFVFGRRFVRFWWLAAPVENFFRQKCIILSVYKKKYVSLYVNCLA